MTIFYMRCLWIKEWHYRPIAGPHVTPVRSYLIQEKSMESTLLSFSTFFEIEFEKHVRGVFNRLLVQVHTEATNRFYFTTYHDGCSKSYGVYIVRSRMSVKDSFSTKCSFICIHHHVPCWSGENQTILQIFLIFKIQFNNWKECHLLQIFLLTDILVTKVSWVSIPLARTLPPQMILKERNFN